VAATHRNIHLAMEKGRFRKDLYYRLCSDIITTPSLHEQMRESPDVLWDLVGYISKRVAGDEGNALAREVIAWIKDKLGIGYSWPGNIRELEQCVRNIMIRREYFPAAVKGQADTPGLAESLHQGGMTLNELCSRYCSRIYEKTGSYAETSRRLGIDRRTVKKYIDG
jgi:transcriptional regulator of acetoin/glycerol metabolism